MFNLLSSPFNRLAFSSLSTMNQLGRGKTLSKIDQKLINTSKRCFITLEAGFIHSEKWENRYYMIIGLCTQGGGLIGAVGSSLILINDKENIFLAPVLVPGATLGCGFVGFLWGVTSPVSFPGLAIALLITGVKSQIKKSSSTKEQTYYQPWQNKEKKE